MAEARADLTEIDANVISKVVATWSISEFFLQIKLFDEEETVFFRFLGMLPPRDSDMRELFRRCKGIPFSLNPTEYHCKSRLDGIVNLLFRRADHTRKSTNERWSLLKKNDSDRSRKATQSRSAPQVTFSWTSSMSESNTSVWCRSVS